MSRNDSDYGAPPSSRPPIHHPTEIMQVIMNQLFDVPMGSSSDGCMESEWRGMPGRELFVAAQKGNVVELRQLLEDPDLRRHVNDLDGDQSGILHGYALNGRGEDPANIVCAILDAGGDVDLRNGFQETPLQMAVMYTQVEIVRSLLERGARVDLVDWEGHGPVWTAQRECHHVGASNEGCCQVLKLVLEADEKLKRDISRAEIANRLRQEGNDAFRKRDYKQARDFYTQSLDVLEDHRSFANRSLVNIRIAQRIVVDGEPGTYSVKARQWAEAAMTDAVKASTMDPTFAKAYYREAAGQMLARDFPRAKMAVQRGLKKCPSNEYLQKLLRTLEKLETSDSISNPLSVASAKADALIASGESFRVCLFCGAKIPCSMLKESCVYCAMPLDKDVDQYELVNILLSL